MRPPCEDAEHGSEAEHREGRGCRRLAEVIVVADEDDAEGLQATEKK